MRIKSWLTRILGLIILGGSAFLLLLERISEADIMLDPPQWLRHSAGLLRENWKAVGLVLIVTGAIAAVVRGYRRYLARARAQALVPLVTENMKRVENQIALYMQAWSFLENRVNDPRFHWGRRVGPWWDEAVERLNRAYRAFEELAEQRFFYRRDLPLLAPKIPPEISHVRPDTVRQQFKQLWLEHQGRMAAINLFREHWNRVLDEAISVLEQDVKRAASSKTPSPKKRAGFRQVPPAPEAGIDSGSPE